MVLVGETREYHSRGEEYMVLFRRDLWVSQQTGGMLLISHFCSGVAWVTGYVVVIFLPGGCCCTLVHCKKNG